METSAACVACGQVRFRPRFEQVTDYLYGTPGTWSLVECKGCGTLQLRPVPSIDEIPGFYQRYFTHGASTPGARKSPLHVAALKALAFAFEDSSIAARLLHTAFSIAMPRAARTVARTYAFMRPGQKVLDVLDYGCGGGELLERVARLGHRTVGLDFDEKALATCRSRGLSVRPASQLPVLGAGTFDIVTCMNVIEHVPDPRALLRDLARTLKPGGVLLIETPNAASWLASRLGAAWRGLETPRHLNVFSTAGLHDLLAAQGLQVRRERFVPCAGFMARTSDVPDEMKKRYRWLSPLIDLIEWMVPTRREVHFLEVMSPGGKER